MVRFYEKLRRRDTRERTKLAGFVVWKSKKKAC